MALNLTRIEDLISNETISLLRAEIESSGNANLPEDGYPLPPSGMDAQALRFSMMLIKIAYDNMSWAEFTKRALELEQTGVVLTELTSIRLAIVTSGAPPSAENTPLEAHLARIVGSIRLYPTLGDLYTALAAFKLGCFQFASSLQLLALAALCPNRNATFYRIIKEKVDKFSEVCT